MSKAGNRHVRAMAIEIAWGWLRFQPQSELTKWYQRRFGGGSKRIRKIGIVALARKLLIELWRFLETGVIPEGAQLKAETDKLRAAIFYPSGGMLRTGIWTTARNRPQDLAREKPYAEGTQPTFEEFMGQMKAVGIELPVQDLDQLAQSALAGIRSGDFVIMLGRDQQMEAQLTDRAQKLARGECPIGAGLG